MKVWIGAARYLAVAGQLALFIFVIERRFEVESLAFLEVCKLALAGFLIHALLPLRFRMPFFFLLSAAGVLVVLGLPAGLWLIGIGIVLVSLCHLPVSFRLRVAVVVLAGIILAIARAGVLPVPVSGGIWPILGSMFMFRLMIYLYDIRHLKTSVPVWQRLSYFFLLPNVCFPLFPVVDYQTYLRSHYSAPAHLIYQKGVQWMFRGFTHLLLYRLIYYYFTISADEVQNIGHLAQFLVTNYLLYLRISGQFHRIVGILCLFGLNLPRTNSLYLLASSFTDYWRRINVYWKNFMQKVFFYPAYFRLKSHGPLVRLLLGTAFVFMATWVLHSYQWFWIRGTFPVTGPDVAFWTILAVFVFLNSVHEMKHGRDRAIEGRAWSLRSSFLLSLRTTGMFLLICSIWSLWTSASVAEWFTLWIPTGDGWMAGAPWVFGLIAAAALGGTVIRYVARPGWGLRVSGENLVFWRSASMTGSFLLLLVFLSHPSVYSHLGRTAADVIFSLRESRLNKGDMARLQKGYYENLLGVESINSQLWELYMEEPQEWRGNIEDLDQLRDDFLVKEFIPSGEIVTKGLPARINRWGMHDRDYEKVKPEGTYRIAVQGASYVVGFGVELDSNFVEIVERRLNEEPLAEEYDRVELLNFGMGGYRAVQQLMTMELKVLPFDPDAIFYVCHESDIVNQNDITVALRDGIEIPFDSLTTILARGGVGPETPQAVVAKRLKKIGPDIITWVYGEFVRKCRENDVLPVWVFLPTTSEAPWRDDYEELRGIAENAGFVMLDLSDVYDGLDKQSIWLQPYDRHPNREGHRLIAERLYRAIRESGQIF